MIVKLIRVQLDKQVNKPGADSWDLSRNGTSFTADTNLQILLDTEAQLVTLISKGEYVSVPASKCTMTPSKEYVQRIQEETDEPKTKKLTGAAKASADKNKQVTTA